MNESGYRNADDGVAVIRDMGWSADVRREVVRAVIERERHSFPANLTGLLLCVIAAFSLPYTEAFLLPVCVRLIALCSIRIFSRQLRARLDTGLPYETQLNFVMGSMVLSGVSWATLLWPIMAQPLAISASLVIMAVVAVGASSICGLLGPLPKVMISYVIGFMLCTFVGLLVAGTTEGVMIAVGAASVASGCVSFGLGAAKPNIVAAEMLVENRRLGEELATALAHAEFLSHQDPLTGLMNRRAFFELGCMRDNPYRERQVLAIDLDHFKTINDRFGHDTGDKVLIEAGSAMRDLARDMPEGPHYAIRMGGEEFTIVLEGVDHAMAIVAAEALRLRIETINLGLPDLSVSCSIGLADCPPCHSLRETLRQADKALYQAKETGRNRVVPLQVAA